MHERGWPTRTREHETPRRDGSAPAAYLGCWKPGEEHVSGRDDEAPLERRVFGAVEVDLDLQPGDGLLQLWAERDVVVLLILLALGLKVVVIDQEGELALVALGLVLLLHLVRVDGHLEALNDRRREHVA